MRSSVEPELSRDEEVPQSGERSFGIVFSIIFLLIGLYPLLSDNGVHWWAIITAGIILASAFYFPQLLFPFNFIWLKIGLILQKVISPLILSLVYIITVVPIGLIMKMIGKDILNLKLDKSKTSYWILRTPPGPKKESLRNQF